MLNQNFEGFLNVGLQVAPGNQGLKDLIAALQWVKENIANFGGDPNNVTINGASVGAQMVHALFVSPRVQGRFIKLPLITVLGTVRDTLRYVYVQKLKCRDFLKNSNVRLPLIAFVGDTLGYVGIEKLKCRDSLENCNVR